MKMPTTTKSRPAISYSFSPSDYHRAVNDSVIPSLAYDGGDVKTWQKKLRGRLIQLLGMPDTWSPSGKQQLIQADSLWIREHPLGTIEKVVYRSEAGADVPAYLCLPKNARPPYTLMICMQGHNSGMHHSIAFEREEDAKPMAVEGDREFALGCMQRGIAALCIEQRSFGLRREQKQSFVSEMGCHDAVMHSLMLGRTLMGERIFDVDRGIDYLATRGDIDMKRIGTMGNSGGGTTAMYSAAILPRVRFAMPSCAFCSYKESLMSIYHCGDNYIPGLLKYAEAGDVIGLAAPKPLVVVAGREDEIFPLTGVRREFKRLQRIYTDMDAADKCKLVIGAGGHRFYADDAWPVMLRLLKNLV